MIRPGRPADADAIGALWRAYTGELASVGDGAKRDEATFLAALQRRIAAGDVRIGVEGDAVVGYIVWQVRSTAAGRSLVVTDLYVAPDERGQRVVSGLLARALDRARSDHLDEVEGMAGLDDRAAHGLMHSYGFVRRGDTLVRGLGVA